MLRVNFTNQFKKDYKTAEKRGLDIQLLESVMVRLAIPEILEEKFKDHSLTGEYKGCRECHIKPDWILIYYLGKNSITFTRTGSHSDLFR